MIVIRRSSVVLSTLLTLAGAGAAQAQSDNVVIGGAQEVVVRDASSHGSAELGAVQVYSSGFSASGAMSGEFNNTADENRTSIFSIGKVGSYWSGQSSNVGVHGHVPGLGDGGYGVVGSFGAWVDINDIGIDSPVAWGALGGEVGSTPYAVIANGDQFSTTGTLWVTSDAELKEDVEDIRGALDIVRELRPSTYAYRKDLRDRGISVPEAGQFGFLAQNVETVLPSLVRDVELPMRPTEDLGRLPNDGIDRAEETSTYKAVQVLGLIPVLTAAVQELDARYQVTLAELANQNEMLRARVAELSQKVDANLHRASDDNVPCRCPGLDDEVKTALRVMED
jgi:hypothetical protein